MRIEAVTLEKADGLTRMCARICFEVADRTDFDAEFVVAGDAPARVEPFVATAAIVGDMVGERRLVIDTPVDPRLVSNVNAALALMRTWWPVDRPSLEWTTSDRVPGPPQPGAAFLMTGGIDSTGLLLDNHARLPVGHPMRVGTGLVVYGLDESTDVEIAEPDWFLQEIARRHELELVAVRTNIRGLDLSVATWTQRIQMAVLSGGGHAALGSGGHLLVGPRHSARNFSPWGTHVMLDHRLGSTTLHVSHEWVGDDRRARCALIGEDGSLLPFIQVCNRPRREWGDGTVNCGRCEKCIRTMAGFRSVGVVHLPSFARPELMPEMIDALPAAREESAAWRDLVQPLRDRGDIELAEAVARYLRRTRLRRPLRVARELTRTLLKR